MTRHKARSTFTFEVKRAAKRTPEVVTLQRTPATAGSSLADQVFGRFSPSPASAPRAGGAEPKAVEAAASAPAPAPQSSLPQPRRVLPDLLSVPADPVEELMAQAAEERTARRRTTEPRSAEPRKPRRAKPAAEPADSLFSFLDALPDDESEAPVPAVRPEPEATRLAAEGAEPAVCPKPSPKSSPRAGRRSLKALAMRAERQGGEPPRLPAGQRWKRRLPKACW
jgi:hypothetical protein